MWEQAGSVPAALQSTPCTLVQSQTLQPTALGLQVEMRRQVLPMPIASFAEGPTEPQASHLELWYLSHAVLNRSHKLEQEL